MDKKEYFGKTDLMYLVSLLKTELDKYAKSKDITEPVQADWNQEDTSKLDFIKNKPEIPDAQIQADWNQTVEDALDYIKNKPDLSLYALLNSPEFIGTPTAPNPHDSTKNSQIATIAYVIKKCSEVVGIKFQKVASYEDLPIVGASGTIYLVPKAGASSPDIYTEYYYVPAEDLTYEVYDSWIPTDNHKYIITGDQFASLLNGTDTIWVGDATLKLTPPVEVSYYLENTGGTITDTQYPFSVIQRFKESGEVRARGTNITKSNVVKKSGSEGFYEVLGDTSVDLTDYVKDTDLVEIETSEVQAAWDAKFPPES